MTRLDHVDAAVRLASAGQEHLVLQPPLPLVPFPRIRYVFTTRAHPTGQEQRQRGPKQRQGPLSSPWRTS